MIAEQRAVNVGGDAPLLRQVARGEAGRGHEHQNRPVGEKETRNDDKLFAPVRVDEDERGEEVADGDAVEHAGQAYSRKPDEGVRVEVVEREPGEERAERVDDERAADYLQIKIALAPVALCATTQSKCYRD